MTPAEAIEVVQQRFPFEGYVSPAETAHLNIARTVLRHLEPGGRILDFGSGPCDKTAVLQALGYKCSAYDDLQDDWHKIDGNRQQIFTFAKEFGIDFKLAGNGPLPFQKDAFDMLMMHDVLEHLHDSPRDLLNDLLGLVRPEGLFFTTVPSAVNIRKRIRVVLGKTNLPDFDYYYWYPGSWRGHVREYTREDLNKLAEHLNLEIIELRGCHHMLQRLSGISRPFYLALTRVFSDWCDSWMLVAKKRPNWAPNKAPPDEELHKIIGKYTRYQYQKE
jgi:SAM-dependent methyltransferase